MSFLGMLQGRERSRGSNSSHHYDAVSSVGDDDGLSDSQPEEKGLEGTVRRPGRSRVSLSGMPCWFLLAQILLVGCYAWIFVDWSKSRDAAHVYSPGDEALRYRKQRFEAELVINSPYNGAPGPETDLAWTNLLSNMNIAVPGTDLKKINAESISVPGQPGMYVAGLSVFHELHCLKRLYQYTWLEHYFPNQTAEEARLHRLHTDHCIDVLRQAIVCHADTALFTLQWSAGETMPRADFSNEHRCVDWDHLNAWAAERAIPESTMLRLQHPTNGPAFPHGKGSHLGASEDHSKVVHEHNP